MEYMGKRGSRGILLSLAIATVASQLALAAPPNAAGKVASQMDAFDRAEIEKLLAIELQQSVDSQAKLPGQKKIVITTSLAVKERRLVIDLGRDAVPDKAGAASERQCHALVSEAISILNEIVSVNGFTCTYGGKDIFYYHPDPPPTKKAVRSSRMETRQDDPPVIVMVSAGHGYFYNPISRQWETRRPFMNGMQEDFVTPYFARDVSTDLINKSYMSVAKARTNGTSIHAASGHPWWKMSARTWLESQYPNNPEIWNSLDNENDPNGQEDDDIRGPSTVRKPCECELLASHSHQRAFGHHRSWNFWLLSNRASGRFRLCCSHSLRHERDDPVASNLHKLEYRPGTS